MEHMAPSPDTSAPDARRTREARRIVDRDILQLAIPSLGALVAEPLFVMADSAFVARISTPSLAGLGLAATVLTTVVGLSIFLAYSTTAAVARAFGAGRRHEAIARGDFDDLPGAGKPLALGDPHDPDWWVKQLIEREQLSLVDALPPPIRLRREAELMPGSLVDLVTEAQVREHLADFNARVEQSWRSAGAGAMSPVVAHRVDVERVVQGWRELTASRRAAPDPEPPPAAAPRRPRRGP